MSTKFPYRRFVIIGTPRTGSSLLWSYLNSHTKILCLRSIYGPTDKINFGRYYHELDDEYYSADIIKYRNEKPIQFLEEYVFKKYTKPYKAIGFKYFYDHDRHLVNKDSLIEYFTKNKDIVFIHVKRRNLLASLFSFIRAKAEGIWVSEEEIFSHFKTELSISTCEKYFKEIERHQNRFDEYFGSRSIQIFYEDLSKNSIEVLSKIQKFIGVDDENLVSPFKKNLSTNLSTQVLNYNELKSFFIDTKYKIFFDN